MKNKNIIILLLSLFISGITIAQDTNSTVNLIPKPVSFIAGEGYFTLNNKTRILLSENLNLLVNIAEQTSHFLKAPTGYDIKINLASKKIPKNTILFSIIKDKTLGKEGYILKVSIDSVTLKANTVNGIFNGLQTLRQLLPDKIESKSIQEGPWKIPVCEITDYPAYSYRGAMLDVSRHFFPVEDVKHYIDLMSLYKLNRLHLHLSDDQGWRIEIKSWPKLTEIGGKTEVGGGKGGYYTQEDYQEIVNYAAGKYIVVIPEIDMPGHTNAALASYTVLNCDGKARELYTGIDVGFSSLCIKKDTTYAFINDVISELSQMTPGAYIHIGGDESHATPMEEYIPFITKVQEIVLNKGKKIIGWDEIAHSKLKQQTIVEYWAKDSNAVLAVKQGAKVLMAPATRTYLDMQYDSTTPLGLHWAGYINVKQAYDWEPSTLVEGINKEDIVGVESPLWTETITNINDLEYMAFPRLVGHAEIGWTAAELRSWDEYKKRLGKHAGRLNALKINYFKSPLINWEQ
jgi:hexosaminidase